MHEHADAQSLPVPGPRDSEDDRQRKLAALRTRLHEEAQAMRTPEDWARCLRLVARLPGETFANILLISAQRPGATILRGYDPWQAMGRQVSRQEQGIAIFSAVRRPGSGTRNPVPSWRDAERVGYLWDLSQASGPTVTARSATSPLPGRTPPGLCDALYWLARREGFAVERAHGCPEDDVTMWTARRIRIPPGPDEYQIVWALAHQLGHVLLHEPVSCPPGTTTSGCTGVPKTEADSVAYVICIRCGIPTAHQFPAPPAWAGRDLRARIQGRQGARPAPPLFVARIVALAKASSQTAALLAGICAGFMIYLSGMASAPTPRGDLVDASLSFGACLVLLAAALFLEYCCRVPTDPDSGDDSVPPPRQSPFHH